MQKLISFLSCITLAISLVIPNGYSIGGLCLLFTALLSLPFIQHKSHLNRQDLTLLAIFIIYGLSMFTFIYLDHGDLRQFDKPSRFLLIVPIFIMMCKQLFNKEWLFWGSCLGASSSSALSIYQVYIQDYHRATGSLSDITLYGSISTLLCLLCFSGALLFYSRKQYIYVYLCLFSGFCGLGSSLLSGTRGSWVALLITVIFLLWQSCELLSKKWILALGTCFIAIVLIMAVQTGAKKRISTAITNIRDYSTNDEYKYSSIGARFELWKASLYMIKKSPLTGVGKSEVEEIKKELVAQGKLSKGSLMSEHAHNDYLEAFSVRGIIGLILLLLLYLVPLRLFIKKINLYNEDWEIRTYAIAGAIIPISYTSFALSESLFSTNVGIIIYLLSITFFWSAIRNSENSNIK